MYGQFDELKALCRSREGAWIEIMSMIIAYVAILSLPRGSVD